MAYRGWYDCCLTDYEWDLIKNLIPRPSSNRGRPRDYSLRLVVDAILYFNRAGGNWRLLPKDFGISPKTVHNYFSRWRREGVWQRIRDHLREKVRKQANWNAAPHVAILDSQSVETSDQGGPSGYDAGKKVKGRKRHLLVDSFGLPLGVSVTPANVSDPEGAKGLLSETLPWLGRLQKIYVDSAYQGQLSQWVSSWRPWGQLHLDVVRKPKNQKGFQVLPRRWLVERGFGWLGKFARLDKDKERRCDNSEAMINISFMAIMLRRLAKAKGG